MENIRRIGIFLSLIIFDNSQIISTFIAKSTSPEVSCIYSVHWEKKLFLNYQVSSQRFIQMVTKCFDVNIS